MILKILLDSLSCIGSDDKVTTCHLPHLAVTLYDIITLHDVAIIKTFLFPSSTTLI